MKLKKVFCVLIGVIVLFVGMWGGSWLCSVFPQGESPYAFVAFMTGFIVTISGVAVIAISATMS